MNLQQMKSDFIPNDSNYKLVIKVNNDVVENVCMSEQGAIR